MVIDFHTHAFPDELADRAFASLMAGVADKITPACGVKLAELLEKMDVNGVDISVQQPVVTKETQTRKINAWAQSIQSKRVISFAGLYPNAVNSREEVDLIAESGFKGIKLHPEYQDFTLDDPAMLRLYDYILSKGLILLIHAGVDLGMPEPYHSSPKMFANAARAMRGGVIVAAHMGGHAQWDDVERYLAGENIYMDTSMGFGYYSEEQFLRIVKAHGADKILFASDSPWSDAGVELSKIRALPLSDRDKELILYKNAQKLLNLCSDA